MFGKQLTPWLFPALSLTLGLGYRWFGHGFVVLGTVIGRPPFRPTVDWRASIALGALWIFPSQTERDMELWVAHVCA
jgi:hypothetical protein